MDDMDKRFRVLVLNSLSLIIGLLICTLITKQDREKTLDKISSHTDMVGDYLKELKGGKL